MTAVMEEKDQYLAAFAELEKRLKESPRAPLHRLRQAAVERFAALGFPTLDDEEWRFTNLAPLTRTRFRLAGRRPLSAARLEQLAIPIGDCTRLVFVNGFFAPELSAVKELPAGAVAGSLAEALRNHPEKVDPHLARYAAYEEHPFTALNTAFVQDGAFLFIPKGKVVAEPIHLLFISTAENGPAVSHPRSLILVGENSQVRLVESYVGARARSTSPTPSPRSLPSRTPSSITTRCSARVFRPSMLPRSRCSSTRAAPSPTTPSPSAAAWFATRSTPC